MKKSHLFIAASLLIAPALSALTIAELKGDWVPDITKTVHDSEDAYRARLKKNGMAPEAIEKAVKSDRMELNLRQWREVISFDATHFGFLQGNACRVVDAKYEQVDPAVVAITVTLSGKPMVLRASGDAVQGIRITGKRDKECYVWVKAPVGESALDPKYMAPPAKDAAGMLPVDVLAKVAELVAAGDEAALKGYFSEECLAKWHREGVVTEWKSYKKSVRPAGETTSRDAIDVLTQFKIRSCVRMARAEGEVYTIEAVYVSPDGKATGYAFSPYFKQIGGRWKIVAPFTYN